MVGIGKQDCIYRLQVNLYIINLLWYFWFVWFVVLFIIRNIVVSVDYLCDLIGYGNNFFYFYWFGDVCIVLFFVFNYEEGGECCVLYGDKEFEVFFFEMVVVQFLQGVCYMSMELFYEYGSCVGVWCLFKLFK